MTKIITLIPVNYNDGRQVPKKILIEFESQLIEIAGGFTYEGMVEGGWKEENTVYRDRSRKYSIVTDNMTEIKNLILEYGRKLEQLAMYIEIVDSQVEFLKVE